MTRVKRYRSTETGETIGLYALAHGARFGAYSISRADDGSLLVNDERFVPVETDDE